jgi:hypothetical protein
MQVICAGGQRKSAAVRVTAKQGWGGGGGLRSTGQTVLTVRKDM